MNQDKRNKKNAQYQANLQKRSSITKSDVYKNVCNGVFGNKKAYANLVHEFVLTQRHGKTVSKELYKYKWSENAIAAKEEYHSTKNGIPAVVKKPKEVVPELTKEEKLNNREYSDFHKKLIEKAYSKVNNSLKQAAEKAKHEVNIEKWKEHIKEYKARLYELTKKSKPFRIETYFENEEGNILKQSTYYFSKKYDMLKKIALRLHAKLLAKAPNYHHIVIVDNITNAEGVLYAKS